MAALRPTWRHGRSGGDRPRRLRAIIGRRPAATGTPRPSPRRDAYRLAGGSVHCLDRVWQGAEVHGALLRIRWATGRQQRRIGDGQNSIQWGEEPPGQGSRSTPMSPCPLTPVSNSSTCAATCPHCGGRRRIVAVYPGGPRLRDLLDRLGLSPPPDRARRPRGALLSTPPGDRAPALPGQGSAPPGPAALPRPLPRPASAPGRRRRPSPTQPCRRDRSPHASSARRAACSACWVS